MRYECPVCRMREVEADVHEYRCRNCHESWDDLIDLAETQPDRQRSLTASLTRAGDAG